MAAHHTETDVSSVTVRRSSTGEFAAYGYPIEVRAYHHVVNEDDEVEKSWEARFRYDIVNGGSGEAVAKLKDVKDPDGSDCSSGWIGFGFLRILPGVEEAVSNVSGVDRVERAEQTLGPQLEKGREAEFNPE